LSKQADKRVIKISVNEIEGLEELRDYCEEAMDNVTGDKYYFFHNSFITLNSIIDRAENIKVDESDKGCCGTDCPFKENKFCNLHSQELHGTFENPTRCPQCNSY